MWQSVDPIAVYNPVFEIEHYIDGQHNGGVFNSGNLNPYIYTYQNPIKFVDPNGKQVTVTESNGIVNIHLRANFTNSSSDTKFNINKFITKATESTNKLFEGADITITIVNDPNATINIDMVDQVGSPTLIQQDDKYSIQNAANGSTQQIGNLDNNNMTLSRNSPNADVGNSEAKLKSNKRSYNSIAKTFRHELGHILGLFHPFDVDNNIEDIDQDSAKINGGDISNSTIRKNFMNSQKNPVKSLKNTGGNGITPQQIEYIKNLTN